MSVARSTGAFFGTAEGSGTAVANNATGNGSEVAVLSDDTSAGEVRIYVEVVSTVAVGTIDISVAGRRSTGLAYKRQSATFSVSPINGTVKYDLGYVAATRYMQVDVLNNATGASATVFVGFELVKYS